MNMYCCHALMLMVVFLSLPGNRQPSTPATTQTTTSEPVQSLSVVGVCVCVCVCVVVMYVLFGWGGGLEVGRWMGVV